METRQHSNEAPGIAPELRDLVWAWCHGSRRPFGGAATAMKIKATAAKHWNPFLLEPCVCLAIGSHSVARRLPAYLNLLDYGCL